MGVVAIGVAERVLHVADQGVEPVDDVECSIGTELEGDRAEIGVGRLQKRLDRRAREARTVVLDPIPQDALKADVVIEEIVTLRVIGKVAADRPARSRRWAAIAS